MPRPEREAGEHADYIPRFQRTQDDTNSTGARDGSFAKVISRRYHLSIASLAYAATTCVLVIGAVNGQNNLLFWIFGLAVAGLLLSGVISGWSLMGVQVRREAIEPAAVGDAIYVRYTVRNSNYLFGAFALVLEELPKGRTWLGKLHSADWPARVSPVRCMIAYLGPRQTVTVEAQARALRRGEASFGPLRISSTFPFGITRKSVTYVANDHTLIVPSPAQLASLRENLGGLAHQHSSTSVRARQGDETFALRDYRPGDAVRSIAWRATARTGRPIVRDPAIQRSAKIWIMLDRIAPRTSLPAHMQDPDIARDLQASVASALLEHARSLGLELGLATPGRVLLAPGSGPRHQHDALDALARLGPLPAGGPAPARDALGFANPDDAALVLYAAQPSVAWASDVQCLDVLAPAIYADGRVPVAAPVVAPGPPGVLRGWWTETFTGLRKLWTAPDDVEAAGRTS